MSIKSSDILIDTILVKDIGHETNDPLGRIYYTDAAIEDYPEDLTLCRDIGDFIGEINELRLEIGRLDPTNRLLQPKKERQQ